MGNWLRDLRYGYRVLRKSAGSTTLALLTLALGIGVNTAIFSVVYAVLLQPLPFAEPGRLVTVRGGDSALNIRDFAKQSQTMSGMGGFAEWPLEMTGQGEPKSIPSTLITGNLFETLGTKPLLGRALTAGDDQLGGARLVVASYGFWKTVLNGDASAIGRKLMLSGEPYTLVGVMPEGFAMPRGTGQLWVPAGVAYAEVLPARGAHIFYAIGRMRDGATLPQVQAEIDTLGKRVSESYPADERDRKWTVMPLHERVVGKIRKPLLVLLAAVGAVLLIACLNLAGLVLAKAVSRRQEIAIRSALGATRVRLVRQLLSESLVLSVAGGAAGILIAYLGLGLLLGLKPEGVPRLEYVGINSAALAFTLGISVLAGLLFGSAPAFQLSRSGSAGDLHSGRVASKGFRGFPMRRLLVVAEIAMALVLVTGAGLLIRSFAKLRDVDPGFKPDKLVTLSMQLPVTRYQEIGKQEAFFTELQKRLQTIPGVESAAVVSEVPLGGSTIYHNMIIESEPPVAEGKEPEILTHEVTLRYFATMGVPMLQGRDFSELDTHGGERVAIVSESFVREHFKDRNPIGQRVRYARDETKMWYTVVGVAGDTKHSSLELEKGPAIYTSMAQKGEPWRRWGVVVVRSKSADVSGLVPAIKRQVWSIDPQLPLTEALTMDEVMASSVAQQRFSMTLLGLFAGCALLLAIVGVYGVLSYLVSQRTGEIGIRMALGARPNDVLRQIVSEGGRLVAAGIVVGLVGSILSMRVLGTLLFGVKPTDPLTLGITATLLAATATLASYLPARRASRIDPMSALRRE
jgi:putative ABC transport system permease protein